MSAASIKDVAAAAGVSLGTVSNVLNRPDHVRPETRERVERAIADLGYVRNDSARQLRAGVSRSLAYVCLDAANPFFTDVARGIDDVARANDLILFLCDSQQDDEREQDFLDQLLEQRVRGVCVTPVAETNDRMRRFVQRGVPVVVVDRLPDLLAGDWCSVGVDDVLGGRLAVEHLLELGHRRIAFVGADTGVTQARDRLDGARAGVAATGRSPRAKLVVHPTVGMGYMDGLTAGRALLAGPARSRPTAAFCANDLIALGFLQAMTEHNLSIPDEMAIVGYDDIVFAAAAAVPLTSVMQPRHLIGRTAAELLLAEASGSSDHVHEHVMFTPELVVRRSTAG